MYTCASVSASFHHATNKTLIVCFSSLSVSLLPWFSFSSCVYVVISFSLFVCLSVYLSFPLPLFLCFFFSLQSLLELKAAEQTFHYGNCSAGTKAWNALTCYTVCGWGWLKMPSEASSWMLPRATPTFDVKRGTNAYTC